MLTPSTALTLTHTSRREEEEERLAELARYDILDTPPESSFDTIVTLARLLFDAPISTVTLIDRDRQWFKAKSGISGEQSAREHSFCDRAMEHRGVFVVPDASADPRFSDNPLVTGDPNIRFYAGASLRSAAGHPLGALCIISPEPRPDFAEADRKRLEIMARIVGHELELRRWATQAVEQRSDDDFEWRRAHHRIRESLDYANLLSEIQLTPVSTEKLSALAIAAWKQYTETILLTSVRTLRGRMTPAEYTELLSMMPGFAL